MTLGRLQAIINSFARLLRRYSARLLYFVLLVALFFDLPRYLPSPDLARQLLTAIAIGVGIWVAAELIRDGWPRLAAAAQQWPPRFRWITHLAMIGGCLFTPPATLSPLMVAEPSLLSTPLRQILLGLALAGLSLIVPLMAAGILLVVGALFALLIWLPFMAIRSTYRRITQRRRPYNEYYRNHEFQ